MDLLENLGLNKSKEDQLIEEEAYKKAEEEISNGTFPKGLKAKAFSQAEGNKNKADALYIKLRAKQLIEEIKRQKQKEKREKFEQYKKTEEYQKKIKLYRKRQKKNDKIIISLIAFILVLLFLSVLKSI